jgi:hypothetical protein
VRNGIPIPAVKEVRKDKKKEAGVTWPRPLFFQFPSDQATWLDDADDDGTQEREDDPRCDHAELFSHERLLPLGCPNYASICRSAKVKSIRRCSKFLRAWQQVLEMEAFFVFHRVNQIVCQSLAQPLVTPRNCRAQK